MTINTNRLHLSCCPRLTFLTLAFEQTRSGENTALEQKRPGLNAKQQLYYNTRGFLSSAALIACQAHHHRRDRLAPESNCCGGVEGDEVMSPPTLRQAARACPEFIVCRFNLKHKQRPDPSRRKQACTTSKRWEPGEKSTNAERRNGIFKEALTFGSGQLYRLVRPKWR